MTKTEFYEEITTFKDLIDFCQDNGCYYIIEDIIPSDDFDEWFWNTLEDLRHRWYWHDLKSKMEEIECPCNDYFIPTGGLDYNDLSDDFDLGDYLDQVIDWGDEEGFWEEDDEDVESDEEEGPASDEDTPAFEMSLTLYQLIGLA